MLTALVKNLTSPVILLSLAVGARGHKRKDCCLSLYPKQEGIILETIFSDLASAFSVVLLPFVPYISSASLVIKLAQSKQMLVLL
jgi:hypothetical protein